MAPTTTIFALGPQLLYFSTHLENKTYLEAQFYKLSILLDDFYFQNGGYIQDGVFQIF
jgi:hypothetical protein